MGTTRPVTTLLLIAGLLATAWAGVQAGVAFGARDRSTPVIIGVVPGEPAPAATPQTLTINGREFQPRLEFTITSPEGGTARFKEGAIEARTDAAFRVNVPLVTRGRYSLIVINPDGGMSPPFGLNVGAPPTPAAPVIERILPETLTKHPEPQTLKVQGQRFAPGLRVVVTDPAGIDVTGPAPRDVTVTSFALTARLETVGTYTMVVINPTGAASNVATIVVR